MRVRVRPGPVEPGDRPEGIDECCLDDPLARPATDLDPSPLFTVSASGRI